LDAGVLGAELRELFQALFLLAFLVLDLQDALDRLPRVRVEVVVPAEPKPPLLRLLLPVFDAEELLPDGLLQVERRLQNVGLAGHEVGKLVHSDLEKGVGGGVR